MSQRKQAEIRKTSGRLSLTGLLLPYCHGIISREHSELRTGAVVYNGLPKEVSLDNAASQLVKDLEQRLQKAWLGPTELRILLMFTSLRPLRAALEEADITSTLEKEGVHGTLVEGEV